MIDLKQIAFMMNNLTERSLLLIDEFGKGTNSRDGIALLLSTVKWLGALHPHPKALISTHFQEIFEIEDRIPAVE